MTIKASVQWNKVMDRLPESGREYLVWTGSKMIVSEAVFFTEDFFANLASEFPEFLGVYRSHKGYFEEFGKKYHFDLPDVYWSELPLAPGEKNPPLPDPYDGMVGRDAYFERDGEIIGIHAIGDFVDGTFYQFEIWGNEYDENHKMLGGGSFRVHEQFDEVVKSLEEEGWKKREAPKGKT